MQRPALAPGFPFLVEGIRDRESIGIRLEDGAQEQGSPAVELFDARQILLGE